MTIQQALEVIQDKKYHKFYQKTVDMAYSLAIHADGAPPKELLTARRPKESVEIQKYRDTIYIEKTEAPVFKVQNSLEKIRKSQDWMIKYPKETVDTIAKDETLEQYMEYDFPHHTSFTNWFFAVAFKQYLIDANAVSLIMPENISENKKGDAYEVDETNKYLEPYPVIYNSAQILDYSKDHYLLCSSEKHLYTKDKRDYEGNIYYLVDSENIIEIKEIDPKPIYKQTIYKHGLGQMPIVKLGGMVKKEMKNLCLYKSRISPMLPELKEALREYSDLQAEVVQHLNSTLWHIGGQVCSTCSGSGKVIGGKDKAPIKCSDCKGKGRYPFNPYESFEIRPAKAGETAVPTPPAGFINKQIDICKLQNERVQDHIFYALSSINFEFLMSTPLNQSGTAKQVDRSEMESFVHSVAEDVIRIFDDHYYVINNYRYQIVVKDEKTREAMLPYINVPAKYDILSAEFLIAEVSKAKSSNLDPSIINASLIEYANKKFGSDEDARKFVVNNIDLDPFASESEDAITLKLQNGGITKQLYTIHCNIKSFIRRAIEENDNFFELQYLEKMKILTKYADEVLTKNSASAKVLQMVNTGGGQAATT